MLVRVAPGIVGSVWDQIAPDVFDFDPAPGTLAAFAARPGALLVVAVNAAEVVVGQCVGYVLVDVAGGQSLYLDNLGVTPSHQRQGIARSLVGECRQWASELGCETAWLATEPDNEKAVALYRSLGANESTATVFEFPPNRAPQR